MSKCKYCDEGHVPKEDGNHWIVKSSDKTTKYLGLFTNKADAIAARKAAEVELGFHPNHGRAP